jgi:hypothetical protein
VCSHAVCLVFVFFLGRLAVPRVGHGIRHAAFSFVRDVVSFKSEADKRNVGNGNYL